eukprot:scaffold706_cov418-Prasinococcus_capsulatus_cf.AAC.7
MGSTATFIRHSPAAAQGHSRLVNHLGLRILGRDDQGKGKSNADPLRPVAFGARERGGGPPSGGSSMTPTRPLPAPRTC